MIEMLRKLTVDQWDVLVRDYPLKVGTPAEQRAMLGVFVVASLALCFNEYVTVELWRLLPLELKVASDDWKYVRKLGWCVGSTFGYIVPTALYARWAFGMSPRDLGLRLDGFIQHLPLYIFFFGLVAPFLVFFSSDDHFQRMYPLCKQAHHSWTHLIVWELSYGVQFIGVEFFFRGFLLFVVARFLGPYAIPVMVLPYCMLHFQKPGMESIGAIIAGMALGVVALRTKSILAGVGIHTAVAWSMDFLSLYQKGFIARLMDS